MSNKTNRRNFLIGSAAIATTLCCKALTDKTSELMALSSTQSSMPERILGKTNLSLPILGLGGAGKTPLSSQGQEKEAIALIERAIQLGIRYFDTAYNYGPSEQYLGKVLPAYRRNSNNNQTKRIYLNTKTDARTYDLAWRHLEESLKRLNTDFLDSWQLHHVSFQEELDEIFSNNGAIKAFQQAQEQGIVKFIGITGHHEPDVIAEALKRYDFDNTLISLNAADIHHPRPFSTTVLPVAQAKNVGVIAMKVPAYGRLFKPHLLQGMEQAMGYTLSLPGVHSCIIAAENPAQLESNIRVAQQYQVLNDKEMKQIEKLTVKAQEDGSFFRRWT